MRPCRDEWAMELAQVTARRSTCCRRQVGCILLSSRGHVLGTGYNGVAAGLPHCNEEVPDRRLVPGDHARDEASLILPPNLGVAMGRTQNEPEEPREGRREIDQKMIKPYACSGASAPSGTNLDACQAIHAEQNALLQCRDIYQIQTIYVTASPCVTCCKLLLNTSCERVVYLEEYPHSTARDLWLAAGRQWEQLIL